LLTKKKQNKTKQKQPNQNAENKKIGELFNEENILNDI